MKQALQDIVVEELEPLGLELFEMHSRGTRSRPVLDVRIERTDGSKVTVDDCARASRAIEARLEAGAAVSARYVLEVSSPGVERPIRNAREWARYIGRLAVVSSASTEGSAGLNAQEISIAGLEGEPGAEVLILEDATGVAQRIPLAAVTKARLAFNWKR